MRWHVPGTWPPEYAVDDALERLWDAGQQRRTTMQPYYEANGITIFHGRAEEILPQLGEKFCDLVVTSPPYNLKKKWWDQGSNGIHGALAKKFNDEWYADEIPEPEYQAQQRAILEACMRACRGSVCYNHKVRYAFKREGRSFHPMEWIQGLPLWCEIVWDRGGGMALNCSRPVVSDERIYVLGKPAAWHNIGLTTVWDIWAGAQGLDHPCPFPLEIPRRLIRMFSNPDSVILDPYVGSGTTLRVAKALGRRGIGIESNEQFCELAVKTLELPFNEALIDDGASLEDLPMFAVESEAA